MHEDAWQRPQAQLSKVFPYKVQLTAQCIKLYVGIVAGQLEYGLSDNMALQKVPDSSCTNQNHTVARIICITSVSDIPAHLGMTSVHRRQRYDPAVCTVLVSTTAALGCRDTCCHCLR